ncbi:MAG: rhomboid family intramembrane serine protease [Bacteroidetes bacterium]|nr:MAG: rhomboid family intramembrane serine protease [Bacteroidota bacterium]
MVAVIVIITALASIYLFSRGDIAGRMAFSAYRVVHNREYYRLITHMFVHGDWMHLIVNMMVFWSFGNFIEELFGYLGAAGQMHTPKLHLLMVYFGGGVTSALLSLGRNKDNPYSLSIGASGGVASVLFTSIFFAPWQMIYLFGVVPIPGIIAGVGYLFYEMQAARKANDNIDHRAHIYGALFGFLYPVLINPSFVRMFLNSFSQFPWL